MGTETFIAIGVLHVELLACQISMVSAESTNYYILYVFLLVVISPLVCIYILHIFRTEIFLEPMQIFANSKRCFESFVEFYEINLEFQGVNI